MFKLVQHINGEVKKSLSEEEKPSFKEFMLLSDLYTLEKGEPVWSKYLTDEVVKVSVRGRIANLLHDVRSCLKIGDRF